MNNKVLDFLIFPIMINFLCSYLGAALVSTSENSSAVQDFINGGYHPVVYMMFVILACLVVPFVEELIFRKWMWALINRFFSPNTTLWTTSVVFAFLHGGWYGTALLPFALFLGYIRDKYGSFRYSTIPHIVFNLTGVILTLGGI